MTMQANPSRRTTNVRRKEMLSHLNALRDLLRQSTSNGFRIGDLVNDLKDNHAMTVKAIAEALNASAQRLGELRRTAAAFPKDSRSHEVDIHFYTISARAARRLRLRPIDVLDDIVSHGIDSTRKATRYLAQKIAQENNHKAAEAAALIAPRGNTIVNRCLFGDYRDAIKQLGCSTVKLIVADPPYGQYGQFPDGKHTTVATTNLACDGMRNDDAIPAVTDLFRLALPKLVTGGCMVLFQPGGRPDAPWMLEAARIHGWQCRHALTWAKGHVQLADASAPYTVSSERILVFARPGEALTNHDCSGRGDVLDFPPVRPNCTNGHEHHIFEKPVALMRHLVAKHSYGGELVFEPFGATGPATVAAIQLNRRWAYAETNQSNFDLGVKRIYAATADNAQDIG